MASHAILTACPWVRHLVEHFMLITHLSQFFNNLRKMVALPTDSYRH